MTLGNHEAKRAGIGEPVRRKEDIRFVSGEGAFGDTWIANRQAYALMIRSPHAPCSQSLAMPLSTKIPQP